ncbi:MAG: cupin domain-containing protein [Hamadaea sp.]|nr:cupin domain-containing protein [Hamadaea sp.]
MKIVSATEDRVITTAAAVTTALAAPSQGSTELCNWRVRMEPGTTGPLHSIDREQLWTVLAGSLSITVDGATSRAGIGETVILPAGVDRQVTSGDEVTDVLVCMGVGGMATVPGNPAPVPLPWAR